MWSFQKFCIWYKHWFLSFQYFKEFFYRNLIPDVLYELIKFFFLSISYSADTVGKLPIVYGNTHRSGWNTWMKVKEKNNSGVNFSKEVLLTI